MNYEQTYLTNLKQLMAEKNLKQSDIAEIAGVDQTRVSRVLGGNGFFTFEQAMKIADYYNMPLIKHFGSNFDDPADLLEILLKMIDAGHLVLSGPGKLEVREVDLYDSLREYYSLQETNLHANLKNDIIKMWINKTLKKIRGKQIDFYVAYEWDSDRDGVFLE